MHLQAQVDDEIGKIVRNFVSMSLASILSRGQKMRHPLCSRTRAPPQALVDDEIGKVVGSIVSISLASNKLSYIHDSVGIMSSVAPRLLVRDGCFCLTDLGALVGSLWLTDLALM